MRGLACTLPKARANLVPPKCLSLDSILGPRLLPGAPPSNPLRREGETAESLRGSRLRRRSPRAPSGLQAPRLPRRQAQGSHSPRLSAPTTSPVGPTARPHPSGRVTAATRPARPVRGLGHAGPLRGGQAPRRARRWFQSSAAGLLLPPRPGRRATLFSRPPPPVRHGPANRRLHPRERETLAGVPHFTLLGGGRG